MPAGPVQYMIMPDPRLEGRANLVSVTSELGVFAAATVPAAGNDGSLYPAQSGVLDADAEAVDYQLVESGGVAVGEFVYKQQDESVWRGKDDPRRLWKFHTPGNLTADSNTIVYSRKFRRIVCFTGNGNLNVDIRYRSIGTDIDYTSWSVATDLAVKNKIETFDHELGALELSDGAMLLFVRTDNVGTALGDIDVYRSDDGGLNWVMHSEKIITRFTGDGNGGGTVWGGSTGQVAAAKWRVRRSGDHIRLVQVVLQNDGGGNEGRLSTLLSTDRGVTWLHVDGTFTSEQVATHGGLDDQYPFDFVATDNPVAGEFILTSISTASSATTQTWRASGQGQWTQDATGEFTVPAVVRSIAMVNDGAFLIRLIFTAAGVANVDDNATMQRYKLGRGDPAVTLQWERVNWIFRTTGWRHLPIRPEMLLTGEGIAVQFAVADQQSTYTEESLQVLGFMDVWTRRSLGENGPGRPLTVDPNNGRGILYDFFWAAWTGRPAPVGNSQVSDDTLWTEALAGTPSISSTQERLDLSVNATGEKVVYTIDYNPRLSIDGQAGPAYQTNGSIWGWVAKLDSGDGDNTPATGRFMHFRVVSSQSAAPGASDRIDVSVRMGPTAVSVYDELLGSYVEAITTDQLDNVEHEYRLYLFDDDPVKGFLTVINLHTGAVLSTDEFELQENNVGSPANFVDFGIDARPAGEGTEGIEWREIWMSWGKGARENIPQNPEDLIGASCKATPQFVEKGIEVSWVGAGGVPGDTFQGPIGHAYAAENVLVPSPRICWRSNSASSQTAIWDADPDNGLGRFFHDAAAMFGITDGSVVIDYDDNVAFTSPAAGITLEPKAFTGLSIGAIRGDTIFLNAAAPQPGEAVGMIAEFTSGTALGKRMLCTLHWDGGGAGSSYLTFEGEDLSFEGVTGGNTFDLYTTSSAGKYPGGAIDGLRYMRVRTLDADTHTGDHRICTLVVGHKFEMSVPIEWRHSDNEQPNMTHYSSKSAIQWSYEEGPPQRTIIARTVGDANRWREQFRAYERQFLQYEKRPMVLVMDEVRESYEALLMRVRSGSQFDNVMWYQDDNGDQRVAGDLSIRFVQEV